MARQGIPGLVHVPPSDREIAQRRLLRWSFFFIAILFGFSALNEWLTPSNNPTDCQPGLEVDISPDSREACNQAETGQAIADGEPIQQDTIVAAVLQETAPATPQTRIPSPPPQRTQPTKEPETKPAPKVASPKTAPATPQTRTPSPLPQRTQSTKEPETKPVPEVASHTTGLAPSQTRIPSPPPQRTQPTKEPETKPAPKVASHTTGLATSQSRIPSPPPQRTQPTKEPETKPAPEVASQQRTTESSVHTVAAPRNGNAPTTQEVKPVLAKPPDKHLAEQGDAFAQYRLGKFYAAHSGPKAPESVSWYKKASRGLRRLAEKGNGEAMYVLGVMYAFGRGVQMDTAEARRWLTQAVEHKVAAARPVLARLVEKHGLAEGNRTDNGG